MIKTPTTPATHPDFGFDCEMYLEDEFLAMADRARAAGWPSDHVTAALLSLAFNFDLMRQTIALDEA